MAHTSGRSTDHRVRLRGYSVMDEYDRWYKGYMFRRRLAHEAKVIVYVILGTLAVVGIVHLIAEAVS